MIIDYTIGADPELFIINTKTKKVVSSIGLIPGKKGDPYTSDDMPKGFGLETDNILAEFNIPPVKDKTSFVNNIEYMKNYIDTFVKKQNPDLGILCQASQIVDKSELQSDEAKLFGCDVDYNVYTESPNPKPKGERTNLRSAGFHIHVGYHNNNIAESLKLIKYFDTYLGVPSIIFDKDKDRRKLYGKAGCFRLTSYGVEYRVLSSTMMKDTSILNIVWNQIVKAITAFNKGIALPRESVVINVINNSDFENAELICKTYNII